MRTLPKIRFGPDMFSSPYGDALLLFPLEQGGTDQTHFSRPPKVGLEGATYGMLPPPPPNVLICPLPPDFAVDHILVMKK